MIYIDNMCQNPWYNLALEEYFLKESDVDEDIVVLWQNKKSVIIGRYQNAAAQFNQKYAAEHGIEIARRMTGGGAVYHDSGNLNYTFITKYIESENIDFRKFAEPVIEALWRLGVKAELSGRNDITVNGCKVSGTAQAGAGNKIMFHGTLMYDVDTETLSNVLKVDKEKIKAKGVDSVKNRVSNIKKFLLSDIGVENVKKEIIEVLSGKHDVREYVLSVKEQKAISDLMETNYSTKKWIFGESKEAEYHNKKRFKGGEVEISFSLNNGFIVNCQINGDFLGLYSIHAVEQSLNGVLYEYDSVKKALLQIKLQDYFGVISCENILECMFGF